MVVGSAPSPVESSLSCPTEVKTFVGKKTTSWPVKQKSRVSVRMRRKAPRLTLRAEDRSSSPWRRDVEVVPKDLSSDSAESLTLQRLVGVLIVVVVLFLRLVVEAGAVAEEEA